MQFIGKFNVSNLLAVYGSSRYARQEAEDVLVVMSTLHSVSGRLEPIHSPEGLYRRSRLCTYTGCFGECAQRHT